MEPPMTKDAAQVNYLRWLSEAHPDVFRVAISRARSNAAVGLGRLGWINFVIQAVAMAGSAVMQKKQIDKSVSLQKKALAIQDAQATADREQQLKLALLDVNTKRAANGQPPVDITGKVIPGSALPVPSALKTFMPATLTASTWITGVPNYVTAGGGLLGTVVLLKALRVF